MSYLDLVKRYPRYLGFGFLHTFFSSIGQTFLVALFIPHFREVFGLSAASMGSYYGLVTIGSACLLFFTGPLIDRVNLRRFSVGVGLLVMLGCLVLASASHLAWLIVGLFFIRHGGQALMSHTASTAMTRYFTLARGKSLGIAGFGIALGEAVLPLIITLALGGMGWRLTYLLLAVCCMVVFVPLSLLLVNQSDDIQHPGASQELPTEEEDESDELNWDRGQVLRHPYFWLLLPYMIMPPFLGTGIFFFQTEIAASKSWSRAMFASTFVAYGVSAALSSFVSGPWVDRMSAVKLLPYALIPMSFGIWGLIEIPNIMGGYLFMILLGISFGAVSNIRSSMWAEVYGRKHLGAIKSFASVLMVLSTALSPALGGWLLDHGHSVSSILWGCVGLIVGSSLLAWLGRPPKSILR